MSYTVTNTHKYCRRVKNDASCLWERFSLMTFSWQQRCYQIHAFYFVYQTKSDGNRKTIPKLFQVSDSIVWFIRDWVTQPTHRNKKFSHVSPVPRLVMCQNVCCGWQFWLSFFVEVSYFDFVSWKFTNWALKFNWGVKIQRTANLCHRIGKLKLGNQKSKTVSHTIRIASATFY